MMEIKELIEKPSLSSLTNMLEKQKSQRESRWVRAFMTWLDLKSYEIFKFKAHQ